MAYRVIAFELSLDKKMDEQSDYFWAPASLRLGSYEQADAQSNFKQLSTCKRFSTNLFLFHMHWICLYFMVIWKFTLQLIIIMILLKIFYTC